MNILPKTLHRVSPETEEVLRNDSPNAKQILEGLLQLIKRRKFFIIIFVVIVAISFGIYARYFHLTDAERAQKELKAAMSSVSKHMILPEGDEPVLATVTDAEALTRQQAFFTGAVNGDQLLLFPRNLKAVIYSPSRNKIINAGPIEQQPQAVAAKSEILNSKPETNLNIQNSNIQNTLTVEVRNGTGKSGLAAQVAEGIRAAGFEVITVADAKNKNYLRTIVISRTKVKSLAPLEATLLTGLAAQIGAEFITDLPDGEKDTSADALIILGGE